MRSWMLVLALAAAAPAWAAADSTERPPAAPAPQAPSPRAQRHLITNPDWLRKPGPDDFSNYYPKGAAFQRESGVADIECDVTAEGKLAGCVVTSEFPLGEGFGEAALKISKYFRMKSETVDGVPVGGGLFQTRIRFNMGDAEPATPPKWLRKPTPEDMANVWPPGAPDTGGEVSMDCEISRTGQATHCSVVSEVPAGKGFGAAAKKLAPGFRFEPARSHGRPIDFEILFPLGFSKPHPEQTGVGAYGDFRALSNAPWQAAPTAADMAAAWPKAAPSTLAEAKVRVRCGFSPDTSLTGCQLLSEEPPGYGFGAAALTLTSSFRTRGALMDDRLLAQARIILPFTFTNPKMGGQAPEWLERPNWGSFIAEDQMTELYPAAAADAGIKTGRGVVVCAVALGGALSGCTIESEDPPGKGFGASALTAISAFTANLWTNDGRPTDGAKVRVPIRFVETEQPTAEPDAAPSGTAAAPAKP